MLHLLVASVNVSFETVNLAQILLIQNAMKGN